MRLPVTALALSLCLSVSAVAQKKTKPNTEEDADAAQQRTVAIALVSTLADEARSFKDQTRRARVQARATLKILTCSRFSGILHRADLLRAIQLAKTFTGETPRAVATLAIARSGLEKRKDPA